MPTLFHVPAEFFLFAAILVGIAFLHRHAFLVSVCGLAVILAYKAVFGLNGATGVAALTTFVSHEWVVLAELFLLLTGFAVLANQFERSNVPEAMHAWLPHTWLGGLGLLAIVFVFSAVLDNIAAAVIGGVVAKRVYGGRVSIGYLAALVAASNAGGAGSVIGDTTTTLMWIGGVSPLDVLPAFLGAIAAFAVFGAAGALQQHRFQPITPGTGGEVRIHWARLFIVLVMLGAIIGANIASNVLDPALHETLPVLGGALWIAIALTSLVRSPKWSVIPDALKGAVFLVALVAAAALMPVSALPSPTWLTTLGLGFLSAVFDNIPLTALALKQGGYDWSLLAYAVGFGGSILWFGSSAGVAISNFFPEARSVGAWLRRGWFVPPAFVLGFFVKLVVLGWHPEAATLGG